MKISFTMEDSWVNALKKWFPIDFDINELACAMFVNRCIDKGYCNEFGDVIPYPTLNVDCGDLDLSALRTLSENVPSNIGVVNE